MKKSFSKITSGINMILMNQAERLEDLELYIGESEGREIYQYLAINEQDAEYINECTGLPVFYSNFLDTFFLGIDHIGTSWDDVFYIVKD